MKNEIKEPKVTPLEPFSLQDERKDLISKASKYEVGTIIFMTTVVIFMYLAAGQSQSMKTALLEDALSIVPPIAFLIGHRLAGRDPDPWFPYGYRRATLIAYLAASVALVVLGLFALYEAVMALVHGTRPSLGLVSVFGYKVWEGWLMIVVLAYSVIPVMFLGKVKQRLATELGDPTLQADAATNRADWLTGLAAAFGVLGVGLGWWWSDATMALLISIDIVRDGTVYLKNAVGDLMDRTPSEIENLTTPSPLIVEIRDYLEQEWALEIIELRRRSLGLFVTGYLSVCHTDQIEEEELSNKLSKRFPKVHDLNVAFREPGEPAT
jgi:cation diffusion facilitator family transporter